MLGELPSSEASEVEAMAVRYPEVNTEIDYIQRAYEALANQLPVAPPPALRDKVLTQLTGSTETTVPAVSTTAEQRESSGKGYSNEPNVRSSEEETTGLPSKQRSMWPLQLGIAASLLVAVASAIAAFYFRGQWKETEQELEQVVAQNQRVASQYETTSQRAQQLESNLSIIESPDYQRIALVGTDVSPESSASVYWNKASAQVYLNASGLPAPPSGQQYQLWAIVDGQPVSAGVLDSEDDPSFLRAMSDTISKASAFAITLEPRGGSESPTLEAMYVQGATTDS